MDAVNTPSFSIPGTSPWCQGSWFPAFWSSPAPAGLLPGSATHTHAWHCILRRNSRDLHFCWSAATRARGLLKQDLMTVAKPRQMALWSFSCQRWPPQRIFYSTYGCARVQSPVFHVPPPLLTTGSCKGLVSVSVTEQWSKSPKKREAERGVVSLSMDVRSQSRSGRKLYENRFENAYWRQANWFCPIKLNLNVTNEENLEISGWFCNSFSSLLLASWLASFCSLVLFRIDPDLEPSISCCWPSGRGCDPLASRACKSVRKQRPVL